MTIVAQELLQYFLPTTVYTCSDEITLVFPYDPSINENIPELPYGGKIQKICSLAAGYASSLFFKHMNEQKFDEKTFNHK